MFERIANGWELAQESYRVLWLDKELLVLPLLSGVCCLLVLASFAFPLHAGGYLQPPTEAEAERLAENPLVYVILFAFYFFNYFVITFFNSALVACAVIRFDGGNPTLSDGLRSAAARLPQILSWSLLAATVGMVLKLIESGSERAGRLAAGLLGAGWSIATYFVVPVLVLERLGPFAALKRSLSVMRESWGEALVSNIGIGFINFALALVAAIPLGIGVMLGSLALPIGAAVSVVLWIILALASSAAGAVLNAALYEYAATGNVPTQYNTALLQNAFVRR